MRNSSFNRLSISQQADILWEEGVYLHTREEPGFCVDLYQLHGQFIEIYFHKKMQDFVVIKSFYSSQDVEAQTCEKAYFLNFLPFNYRGIAC